MHIHFGQQIQATIQRLSKLLSPVSPGTYSIGLELGKDRLNMVQMESNGKQIVVRAATSLPYPCSRAELFEHPQILKTLLKKAYSSQPFKGKRIVSCMSSEDIKIINVAYRFNEGDQDATAIIAELRERFQNELDEMVVDFLVLRQDDTESGKREALVAMSPRKKVMAYLELLTHAGVSVDALDVGPAALARLVRHAGAVHTPEFPMLPNILLVNFARDASFLTVIWGRRLMLDRTVEFSENRMVNKLKQVLNMPEELALNLLYAQAPHAETEADKMVAEVLRQDIALLVQEINKTLVYMASRTRGKSVDKIYLGGHLARYSGIHKYLQEQLQVPIELLNPVVLFAPQKPKKQIDPGLGTLAGIALTTGLALRGVAEHG